MEKGSEMGSERKRIQVDHSTIRRGDELDVRVPNTTTVVTTQVKSIDLIGDGPGVLVEVTERGVPGFELPAGKVITVRR